MMHHIGGTKVETNVNSLLSKNLSIGAANKALHSVIIPQILYPATFNNMGETEIEKLQVKIRAVFRKKMKGRARNLPNDIVHGHKALGGMGIDKLEDPKKWMEKRSVQLRCRHSQALVARDGLGQPAGNCQGDKSIVSLLHYNYNRKQVWHWATRNKICMVSDLVGVDGMVRYPNLTPLSADAAADVKQAVACCARTLGVRFRPHQHILPGMTVRVMHPSLIRNPRSNADKCNSSTSSNHARNSNWPPATSITWSKVE
jgi:hypothetical protein